MILFHGGKNAQLNPSSDRIGEGFEANSALGFWATPDIDLAISYAVSDTSAGFVHVFHMEAPELVLSFGYEKIIFGPTGYQADREIALPVFDDLRSRMMSEGIQGIFCDEPDSDLHEACCIFHPESLQGLGVIRMQDHAWLPARRDPSASHLVLPVEGGRMLIERLKEGALNRDWRYRPGKTFGERMDDLWQEIRAFGPDMI